MTQALVNRAIDFCAALAFPLAIPFLVVASRRRWRLRLARRLQDGLGVTVMRNHYYEPVLTASDITRSADGIRDLPGLDLNPAGQAALLDKFTYADELLALEGKVVNGRRFTYANSMFGVGDAEALYSMIRTFKPNMLVEIGSGNSTLVARLAIAANRAESPDYDPEHICFEPFENSWLEGAGAQIRRERIERADHSVFARLKSGDILFIDSTHVLRAMGDVECEYLRILPALAPGVIVHIHDIFTPRDYPSSWISDDRRFWTEQYLLEAFLSGNKDFEVLLALNDQNHQANPALYRAFPVLGDKRSVRPGSFWIRRRD